MPLPDFDPQGTGPQGAGGIPPEAIRQALREAGGTERAEDRPEVQAILNREVDTVAAALGLEMPATAQIQPQQAQASPQARPIQQPAPNTLPPQGIAATGPGQPPETPAGQDSESARIQRAIQKYGGRLGEVAKAYIHADAARTQAQQGLNAQETQIQALQRTVDDINAQLAAVLTPRSAPAPNPADFLYGQPSAPQPPYQQPQPTYAQQPAPSYPNGQIPPANGQGQGSDFWSAQDPVPIIRQVVDQSMRENLLAYDRARATIEQQEADQKRLRDQQADLVRLRPIMSAIYASNRSLYDSMPETKAWLLVLDQAKDREAAQLAAQFYQEISGMPQQTPPTSAPGSQGQGGTVPLGGSGQRQAGSPPGAPASGGWGETKNVQQLWRANDGSVGEMRALTDVLKERGFGQDIPIF